MFFSTHIFFSGTIDVVCYHRIHKKPVNAPHKVAFIYESNWKKLHNHFRHRTHPKRADRSHFPQSQEKKGIAPKP
jgi:hypothetical protein